MDRTNHFALYPSLRDRVIVVTGGASGIGAAMVEQFAWQGSQVAFLDIARELAAELVDRLGPVAHAPLFFSCDVTDIAALRAALGEIERRLGPVGVLVNNAANDDRHDFARVTPEYWDERMAVNLRHYFFATQAVVPAMRVAGGGSVINLGSIAWVVPSTGFPVYVTAKAAIVGLTRTLAHELGASGIRVNCIMPGAILTERQRRLWITPEYLAEIVGRQALKRELTPQEVARLALFLAADDSAAITNQSYVIDGGWV
jgi:D-xylose 1-dehydrogenase